MAGENSIAKDMAQVEVDFLNFFLILIHQA